MTPQERHNAIFNISGEALWGFQAALVTSSTVLTVLLLRTGARTSTIGLIPTIEGGVLLFQVVGIYLFRHHKTRKWRLVLWHYFVMIPFLFCMGMAVLYRAHLSGASLVCVLLLGWGGFFAATGVVLGAWQDWIAHLFHEGIRGTVTGLAWGSSSLAGVGATLLAGRMLQARPGTDTYGYLYIAAAGIAAVSISTFLFIRDPAEDLRDEIPPRFVHMLGAAMASLRDANFRAILAGRCLCLCGFCIGPFIAVYFRQRAHLADSMIVTLGAAQTLGSAISCISFGRLGDRVGHRLGFLMGAVSQIACLLSILLIPGAIGCLLAFLFAGGVLGVLTISYMNLVLESCPHDIRSAHLVIGNIIVGIVAIVAPIVGSRLAQWQGVRSLMLASLGISCVATLWITLRVSDPRRLRSARDSLLTDQVEERCACEVENGGRSASDRRVKFD